MTQKKFTDTSKATLACLAFSKKGVALGLSLAAKLKLAPWTRLNQNHIGCLKIYAPRNLWLRQGKAAEIAPYEDLASLINSLWQEAAGIIFIGATGIAVRAIAPFVQHKSQDPAVIVLDSSGKFVISLLSGHLGGGNSLAAHLGQLINAMPVITTESDNQPTSLALDLLLQKHKLKILNWRTLAPIQGRLLEEGQINLWDPLRLLPVDARLKRKPGCRIKGPFLAIHWAKHNFGPDVLQAAPQILHIGIGFRKNLDLRELEAGLERLAQLTNIELAACAALATVTEKAGDSALLQLAQKYDLPVKSFSANELANIPTPNPSVACSQRFDVAPFSVCEGASLASAARHGRPFLLKPKITFNRTMAFAIAISLPEKKTHAK